MIAEHGHSTKLQCMTGYHELPNNLVTRGNQIMHCSFVNWDFFLMNKHKIFILDFTVLYILY